MTTAQTAAPNIENLMPAIEAQFAGGEDSSDWENDLADAEDLPLPTRAVKEVLHAPAMSIEAKRDLRFDLLDKLTACKNGEELDKFAPMLDLATRKSDLTLLRAELTAMFKSAYFNVAKVKLTAPVLAQLFPVKFKRAPGTAVAPMTEFGITQRLKDKHGDKLMYAGDSDRWHVYKDGVWAEQAPKAVPVVQLCRSVVKELREAAQSIQNDDARAEALAKVEGCERVNFTIGAVAGLAGEEGIIGSTLDLNVNVRFMAVKNGVIDLHTGELLPHSPHYKLTMRTRLDYSKDAKCPTFIKTLFEVFGSLPAMDIEDAEERTAALDKVAERVAFFKRAIGYAAMGVPKEKLIFFATGGGNNGKSAVFGPIADVFGDYGNKFNSGLISAKLGSKNDKGSSGPREDLLRLRGNRFVLGSEISQNSQFIDGDAKDLSGGADSMVARGMFGLNSVVFKPTAVMFCPCNVLPAVINDDEAMWNRIALLPFDVQFGDKPGQYPIDGKRAEKLATEHEGILTWIIEGALEYQRDGLAIPQQIKDLKDYRRQTDGPLAIFVETMCEVGHECRATTEELFAAWQASAVKQNEKFAYATPNSFNKAMQSRGFKKGQDIKVTDSEGRQCYGWHGIAVADTNTKQAAKPKAQKDMF